MQFLKIQSKFHHVQKMWYCYSALIENLLILAWSARDMELSV